MAFKFIVALAFVAVVSAVEYHHGDYHHHQPAVYHHQPALVKHLQPALVKHVEYEAPAKYDFSYSVHDEHTGDIKQQHESRDGDVVHGSYSLLDADGHHRVVEYSADHHNGFNAVVRREPTGHHHAQPVHKVLAAPVHKVLAAPVTHHYQHAAPVVHHHQQHYAAPVHHHHAVPVAKFVAPVHHAPVHHVPTYHHEPHHYDSHVSVHAAGVHYHH
ncbi:cuticle protein 8-like [Lutzomyia longipalpis]|uniref:cuticle protein 8-like n=1 Tax=Lutzomyia longipalpis TaxID=7200 RepID=UPI00248471B4|nr:cuticle protein 8-like [Lutzomyia longipalpis]